MNGHCLFYLCGVVSIYVNLYLLCLSPLFLVILRKPPCSVLCRFCVLVYFYSKPTRCTNVSNLFILEWHCTCFRRYFRPSSGVQDCTYSNRHLSNRYCCLLDSKQTAVSVWQMSVVLCTVLNSRWWTEKPSETCRVSFQNKINLIHWCV